MPVLLAVRFSFELVHLGYTIFALFPSLFCVCFLFYLYDKYNTHHCIEAIALHPSCEKSNTELMGIGREIHKPD